MAAGHSRLVGLSDACQRVDEIHRECPRNARGALRRSARKTVSLWGMEDAYPTLATKAAALAESIARNHGLVDGNNPLAWFALRVFLRANGADLRVDEDIAYAFIIHLSSGRLDIHRAASWIERYLEKRGPTPEASTRHVDG